MGAFSSWHILIVGLIALLLFGERLPSVMRSLGGSLKEFKRGMDEVHNDVRRSMEQVTYEPSSEKPAESDGQHALGSPATAETAPQAEPFRGKPAEPIAGTPAAAGTAPGPEAPSGAGAASSPPGPATPADNAIASEAHRTSDSPAGAGGEWDYERAMARATGHQASGASPASAATPGLP